MGEALIGRYGSGGDVEISNETKQMLGLNNNASMDDIISSLALKDPNYATIIVTLLDVDEQPIPNANIVMQPISGVNLTYTTNGTGQCLFKTNAGQVNLIEQNMKYIDLRKAEAFNIPAIPGDVKRMSIQRTKRESGYTFSTSSNSDVVFSKFINSVDVLIEGGSGGGGGGIFGNGYWSSGNVEVNGAYGGKGGNSYINKISLNPVADRSYSITIGAGGSGGSYSGYNSRTKQSYRTPSAALSGANGTAGNGTSGGTSTFSNILSATGGGGGKGGSFSGDVGTNGKAGTSGNGTITGGAGGSKGSITGYYTYNASKSEGWADSWYDVSVTGRGESGKAGSLGKCIINNFQYKI